MACHHIFYFAQANSPKPKYIDGLINSEKESKSLQAAKPLGAEDKTSTTYQKLSTQDSSKQLFEASPQANSNSVTVMQKKGTF